MIHTIIADASESSDSAVSQAAEIIKRGGLAAFPTETVYGLGANAFDKNAVKKIYEAKGRPSDNPLIIHVLNEAQINEIVTEIPENARKLLNSFSPGPLTLIFNKKSVIPDETSSGLKTVAVRIPSHPIARLLLEKSGLPIAAPSANLSGKPSPTNAQHVKADLFGKVDIILDGGPSEFGLESTVVDVTSEKPVILRPGSITVEMLKNVVDLSVPVSDCTPTSAPKSPGMKYRHYAPEAHLTIITGKKQNTVNAIRDMAHESAVKGIKTGILTTSQNALYYTEDLAECIVLSAGDGEHPETIAANIFSILREFDRLGVREIFAEDFGNDGIGFSIMNRLNKAAGYNIIHI